MHANETIRIWCGADRSQALPFRVLAHAIQRRTTRPVELHAIDNGDAPQPTDARHQPYTDFSFARFAIPALAGRAGRAIYLDSDMLVLCDIAELWDTPFDGAKVLIEVGSRVQRDRGKHAAVMLLDCAALDWDVQRIVADLGTRYDYDALMAIDPLLQSGEMAERLPQGWNDLDCHDAQRTRNIHFTEIRTQPWVCATHPCGELWVAELLRAIETGSVDAEFVRGEVREGYARPSLLMELGLAEGLARDAIDPEDMAAMVRYDAAQGFVAHRALLQRFAARKQAIRVSRRPWLAWWYRLRG